MYDGILFFSPFLTPTVKYPFNIKDIVKAVKKKCAEHNKLLFISMDGVDDQSDRKINKKKAK